ncbi:WD40 repeat-containing protein [Thermodesulfobium narugense DSM 14796]|uniref:Cilia- and flagella-associated protein 251 n=1 Tax=Thermodesulfobium narugense DSM 14796 TaxID=747365 RepID=M1E5Y8_9BACT|nr:hypothetical protein [Thermodesulfobium narugense]AEE14561.1 WD40 repeat-containing protein [Thermodesulfobium narugense DSM 14796]
MKKESIKLLDNNNFNISLNSTILNKIVARSIEEIEILEVNLKKERKCLNVNKIYFDILHKIYWDNSYPTSSTISKNAKFLVIGFFNGVINFWSMIDGLYLGKIKLSKSPIISISTSENEEFIAVGTWDGYIFIYSILQGKIIYNKKIENKPIRKIHFLDDSDLISYLTDDSKVYFLSLKNNKKLLLHENNLKITAYDVILNDGLIFLGFVNGLIEMFNFNRNVVEDKFFKSKYKILNLSVSKDCKYLLSADEGHSNSLGVYNINHLKPIYFLDTFGTCLDARFVNFSDIVISVINSSSNLKVLSKKNSFISKSVIVSDKNTLDLLKRDFFELNEQISTAFITSDTKNVCFGTKTGFVNIFSLENNNLVNSELIEINVPVKKIFINNEISRLIFVSKNGNVYIYKDVNLKNFYILDVETNNSNLFISENNIYWTNNDKRLYILDFLAENVVVQSFDIDFNPHNTLLFKDFFYLSTYDGQIFIFDFISRKLVDCFNTEIEDGKFSVNEKFNIICYYNNKNLKLYDRLGRLLNEIKFDFRKISLLTFSSDGLHFAFVNDDEIFLYDLVSSEKLKTLRGHYDKVAHIRFRGNSNILLSVGFDKIINFWKF